MVFPDRYAALILRELRWKDERGSLARDFVVKEFGVSCKEIRRIMRIDIKDVPRILLQRDKDFLQWLRYGRLAYTVEMSWDRYHQSVLAPLLLWRLKHEDSN